MLKTREFEVDTPEADCDHLTDAALDWLAARGERRGDPAEPFFLFLHYYDAHDPYESPHGATPSPSALDFDEGRFERQHCLVYTGGRRGAIGGACVVERRPTASGVASTSSC